MKEDVQEMNSHNKPDCSNAINSVGDGSAVEYYFASDARWGKQFFVCPVLNPEETERLICPSALASDKWNLKIGTKQASCSSLSHHICSRFPVLPLHSAIIEHTNKVLYLEDDDVAIVKDGHLSIHRMNRQAGEDPVRAVQTLQMELQQIMKGQIINTISSFVWICLRWKTLQNTWERVRKRSLLC